MYACLWNNQPCLSRALEPPGSESFCNEFWLAKSLSNLFPQFLQKKQNTPEQNKHQNWLSPFPSHQLFHLGDNNRERQALDDDRHEGCAICLLMSLCVSPHFCPPHLRFPFFLKSSLLVRCSGGSLQGNGAFLIKTLKLPKQVGSFSSFLGWVSCQFQVIFGFREILFTDRQTVCLWSQELQITAWVESAEPLFFFYLRCSLRCTHTWLELRLCPKCTISVYGASVLFQAQMRVDGELNWTVTCSTCEVINCSKPHLPFGHLLTCYCL